jgi:hypothetical protein
MKLQQLCLGLTICALTTIPCLASSIDLGINGDAKVGSTFIEFGNYPLGTVFTPAPGYGNFVVSIPPTSVLPGVTSGETGMIQSLAALTTPPGMVFAPNPTSALPFMTFDATGNLKVFLTELLPGATTGPFDLTNTPNGAVASFEIDGFVYNTVSKTEEDITGTFSATFNGLTITQLQAMATAGVVTPFSATFSVTTVPEPGTLLLMGMSLLGAGLIFRRRLN